MKLLRMIRGCRDRNNRTGTASVAALAPAISSKEPPHSFANFKMNNLIWLLIILVKLAYACHLTFATPQQTTASGKTPGGGGGGGGGPSTQLVSPARRPRDEWGGPPNGSLLATALRREPDVDASSIVANNLHEKQPQQQQMSSATNDAKSSGKLLRLFKRRRKNKIGSGSEVMQLNDNNNNSNDKLASSQDPQIETKATNDDDKQVEILLVRQLSDSIMNNEREMIRQKLTNAQMSGQLTEETSRLTRERMTSAIRRYEEAARSNAPLPQQRRQQPALLVDEDENSIEDAFDDEEEDDDDDDEEEEDEDSEMSEQRLDSRRLDRKLKSPAAAAATASASTLAVSEKKRRRMADERALSGGQQSGVGSGSISWPWDWLGVGARPTGQPKQPSGDAAGVAETSIDSSPLSSSGGGDGEGGPDMAAAAASETTSSQTDSEQILVTCSPDYDEPPMMEANMNELMLGGANLSAEQRQQLLNGADMAGLLAAGGNNQTSGGQLTAQQQQQQPPMGQCIPAGTRMIEVITKVVTPILFTIIIIVGLLGNIIVVCVIWEDKKYERGEWSPTNLLILDLSIADLSFIIFCIPFTGWDYAVGHWVFGSDWCKTNQYLIVVCALSSIYTLVLMSCDRYMAIVYPIECINYRTSGNMLRAIIIKWIAILLFALPTISMHGLVDSPLGPDQYNCRFLSDSYNPLTFQITFFITSYFLPLVLIFFLYLGLLRRLWCGQRPRGHKESTKALESKKKITRMVASIVVVFAVCWCPIQVMLILMRLKSFPITATYVAIQVFAHTLGYMNSCVNPFIYAFTTDFFYQSFKRSRFGGLCLAWFCCGHYSSQQQQQLNNNGLNNGHNTNGLNNSFGHPQGTTVVIHSAGSGGGGGPRNSLQLMASAGSCGGSSSTLTAERGVPFGQRTNKSLGNIFASRPLNEGELPEATTAGAPTPRMHCSRVSIEHEKPLKHRQLALEPRDRPQMYAKPTAHNHQVQQQQQVPMPLSSSASHLGQSRQAERKKTAASSELIPRQPTASAKVFQSLEQLQQQQQTTASGGEMSSRPTSPMSNQHQPPLAARPESPSDATNSGIPQGRDEPAKPAPGSQRHAQQYEQQHSINNTDDGRLPDQVDDGQD